MCLILKNGPNTLNFAVEHGHYWIKQKRESTHKKMSKKRVTFKVQKIGVSVVSTLKVILIPYNGVFFSFCRKTSFWMKHRKKNMLEETYVRKMVFIYKFPFCIISLLILWFHIFLDIFFCSIPSGLTRIIADIRTGKSFTVSNSKKFL